jgi:hypothetical protein
MNGYWENSPQESKGLSANNRLTSRLIWLQGEVTTRALGRPMSSENSCFGLNINNAK